MARGHGQEVRGISGILRSSVDEGRFGRMFRWLRPAFPVHSEVDRLKAAEALTALAGAMNQNEFKKRQDAGEKFLDSGITEVEEEDENPTVSAGYTYLGQFIDHDITFDPASSLDKLNDPDALADFRTPRLDLDSVYGRGPDDQPYLYRNNGFKDALLLATGPDKRPPILSVPRPDHQRNGESVALIGDPRNDENLLVGQIHNLFVRFHNAIMQNAALVPDVLSEKARFAEAQRLVRWHYQWIVINDFLPRIVGMETTRAVLGHTPGLPLAASGRGEPHLNFYRVRSGIPYMPIEFSVAAYRFGHSMVRPSYSLSETVLGGSNGQFQRVPIFTLNRDPANLENLNGFRTLPDAWGIDWSFFYPDLPRHAPAEFKIPQPSYRMDTQLVDPLASLPAFMAPGIVSLAERNLHRSLTLQLPSGQSVAEAMGIKPMSDDELFGGREETKKVLADFPLLAGRAPLWYYILREAEQTQRTGVPDEHGAGHHLGPVGGRIVAEVLIGLIWNDHQSYLYQAPHWAPPKETARAGGKFEMSDLIRFVDGPSPFVAPVVEKPYGT